MGSLPPSSQRQACHKLTSRLFALRRSRLPAVQNGSVVRHQLRAAVGGVCTCPHLQRRIAGAARLRRDRKLFGKRGRNGMP
uniref:Uncharacterized protein n=1 Tax=Toxoplasma gondii COUG TaxID=1074873 RepID=A0A2G8XWL9_TOXGO|nr:hypothetical protein TGCOUG_394170 [Toxoplasma gondii COUG]